MLLLLLKNIPAGHEKNNMVALFHTFYEDFVGLYPILTINQPINVDIDTVKIIVAIVIIIKLLVTVPTIGAITVIGVCKAIVNMKVTTDPITAPIILRGIFLFEIM